MTTESPELADSMANISSPRSRRPQAKTSLCSSVGTFEFVELDLSSFASVRCCASSLLARDICLKVLVNNAGMNSETISSPLTVDGFETLFQVNFLSPFLLTVLLAPLLVRNSPSRVIHVSSQMHRMSSATISDFTAFTKPIGSALRPGAYAASKLGNVLFAYELHRRLSCHGVSSVAVTPGAVASDIWRNSPGCIRACTKY